MLAAVRARQLDTDALKKIGQKYGVDAVFLGEITYSEPRTDVRVTDITKMEGGVRTEIMEVSAQRGVSGAMQTADPREEMVDTLVYHLTHDFRPSTVRQPVK